MSERKPFIVIAMIIATMICVAYKPASSEAGQSDELLIKGIKASSIIIDDNRIIPAQTVLHLTAPYLDRPITYIDLEKLRNELTRWLIDNGYINSGVIIPDQEIRDDSIRLRLIEGKISSIKVTGNQYFSSKYFVDRIALSTEQPFRINNLQERFQLFYQDQRLTSINADLSAGLTPGEGNLSVRVQEASPWKISLGTTNDNPPDIGSLYGSTTISRQNPTGSGDTIAASFGGSEGGYNYSGHYSLPLSAADDMLDLYYRHSETKVINNDFEPLDIRSRSNTSGIRISHPLTRSIRREIRPSLTVDYRESRNYLLGQGFSFSQFENNGESHYSAARPGIEWIERRDGTILAAASTLSTGLSDENFTVWSGRVLAMQRTGLLSSRLDLRGELQYAFTILPPMEKYALGGISTVRGYRKNLLMTDCGTNYSLEWWFPLLSNSGGNNNLLFGPFADYGRGWNKNGSTQLSRELASIGVGMRLQWERLSAELFYGYALLRSGLHKSSDPQEDGFHFAVTWNVL